jgi:hypothetical protein
MKAQKSRRGLLRLAAYFAICAAAASALQPGPAAPQQELKPKLEFEPAAIDFGNKGHHERPAARLTLRNSGGAPLEITAIKTS